ncbi:aspartate dehydrogenase [Ottowia thiooxydans]|uniref:aspartate dehydrogenase n=1 Tax=Ottowia thiooxydans TaxID=219182 RepID=UPI0003FA1157|nr:aspartate dehydrogenase [Ottowia thiooxydans]
MQSIALIGYGGTAQTVVQELTKAAGNAGPDIHVVVRPGKVEQYRNMVPPMVQVIDNLACLPENVGLVIETAGHSAVSMYGHQVLSSGRDFGLISSGALADETLLEQLRAAALESGKHLLVFNGAVAAIDAITSAKAAGLQSLCYTGIKPATAWEGTPAAEQFDLGSLTAPTVIFEGSAREVALAYPKNANVAATVALAGVGMENTSVRLIADPHATVNRHRLDGTSALGRFEFETEARPSASNPKTSSSTAFSILAYLRGGPNALRLT